jgi:hypothetical protein
MRKKLSEIASNILRTKVNSNQQSGNSGTANREHIPVRLQIEPVNRPKVGPAVVEKPPKPEGESRDLAAAEVQTEDDSGKTPKEKLMDAICEAVKKIKEDTAHTRECNNECSDCNGKAKCFGGKAKGMGKEAICSNLITSCNDCKKENEEEWNKCKNRKRCAKNFTCDKCENRIPCTKKSTKVTCNKLPEKISVKCKKCDECEESKNVQNCIHKEILYKILDKITCEKRITGKDSSCETCEKELNKKTCEELAKNFITSCDSCEDNDKVICPKLEKCYKLIKCEAEGKCKNLLATCNMSVRHVLNKLTNENVKSAIKLMQANDMYDYFAGITVDKEVITNGEKRIETEIRKPPSPHFTEVTIDKVQELANEGHVVVGAAKAVGNGHVVIVAPEGKYEGEKGTENVTEGKWNGVVINIPFVMDTGAGRRVMCMRITGSWIETGHKNVKFFKYTPQENGASTSISQ